MTPEDTCRLHFGAQAGCPKMGGSPGLVLLHVLTAVLKRALMWNRGPGRRCWELSRCCDLSSFSP